MMFGSKMQSAALTPLISTGAPGQAGNVSYRAPQGVRVMVPSDHVEELEAQGWARIAPPRDHVPMKFKEEPPRPLMFPHHQARLIAGPRSLNPCTVEGRTYRAAPDTALDVPVEDARILIANGWFSLTTHGTGPSSARPLGALPGSTFADADLRALLVFDGVAWRHGYTGALVGASPDDAA